MATPSGWDNPASVPASCPASAGLASMAATTVTPGRSAAVRRHASPMVPNPTCTVLTRDSYSSMMSHSPTDCGSE
jgi:hypothetical protein